MLASAERADYRETGMLVWSDMPRLVDSISPERVLPDRKPVAKNGSQAPPIASTFVDFLAGTEGRNGRTGDVLAPAIKMYDVIGHLGLCDDCRMKVGLRREVAPLRRLAAS